MAEKVEMGFDPDGIMLPIERILPLRQLKPAVKKTHKYHRIAASPCLATLSGAVWGQNRPGRGSFRTFRSRVFQDHLGPAWASAYCRAAESQFRALMMVQIPDLPQNVWQSPVRP